MAWALSRRKGFFLAEAAVACLIAAIFIAATFSALLTSGALLRGAERQIRRERLKRESLAGYAASFRFWLPDDPYGNAKASHERE